MTTQTNAKIRLVRCPKCKLLLPEPEIPVYKCGGCDTVLEAKKRKTNTKGKGLNCDGSDANENGEVEKVLNEREIKGPSQEGTISIRGESLPDSDSDRNEGDCLNQETTISKRGAPLSEAGSGGNQEISATEECLPDAGCYRNQDSCINGKFSGEGDCLPDTGRNSIEDICQNQETTISAGEESSPDTSNKSSENNSQDYSEKQSDGKIFPPELPSSPELCSHEDKELPEEITEQTELVRCEYNADQNVQDSENESGDSDKNWIGGGTRSFSDDFFSSMEFPETEDSSPELVPNTALRETTTTPDQWAKMDKTESEKQHDYYKNLSQVSSPLEVKKHKENDFSSKVGTISDGGDRIFQNDFSSKGGTLADGSDNISVSQHCGSSNECKFEDDRREIPQNSNSEIPSSTEVVSVMPSSVVDANTAVDEDSGVHNFDNLETEGTLAKEEISSPNTDKSHLHRSILSDNVDTCDDQHLGAPLRMSPQEFRQHCTSDTPDSLLLGNSGSEFGLKHRELSKSPTKCYYGHDGSASSNDDDRIPGRLVKPPRRRVKHSNIKNTNGLHVEDGPQENDLSIENLEMQYHPILGSGLNELLNNEPDIRHQARKHFMLPEKNQFSMKSRNKQDDLHDPRSFGRTREDREEHISSLPFIPVHPHSGQRKSSPPPYPLNTFKHYSGLYSSDASSYPEPGKMELLRMVNKLKDELNRMQISNRRFPSAVSGEENYIPLYHDHHPAPGGEPFSDLSYSRYPRRYSQEKGLPQLYQPPKMAFSGDAADYRWRVDSPYLHYHMPDWHYSAQLPSHAICCNKVHCMGHSGTCYTNSCSTSSSPHRYKSSEFSVWDCDTISVDHGHRDNGMRNLHLRERYQSMKQHVRPVAGGNPIIACYHCSKLLQLPADFLLLGKQCHKLRCNACRKVMKFSLQSSKHLVPYIPDDRAPPPSMVGDYSGSIPQGNWESATHSNDNPDAEPLSCTDDYGISFERSISTEGEPSVITPPRHPVVSNSRNRKIPSGDSGRFSVDRKMKAVLEEHQNKPTKSVGALSKISKGRNSSSEIKELPATGGSPLHQLMGYSSPSAVMKK